MKKCFKYVSAGFMMFVLSAVLSFTAFDMNVSAAESSITLVSAKQTGDDEVTITWEKPSIGYELDGYTIRRTTGDGDEYSKEIYDADELSWTDSGLSPGITYTYTICYYYWDEDDDWQMSDYSDPLSVTIKVKAPTIKAASYSMTSIKVSWAAKPDNITAYEIYRASSKNGTYDLVKTVKTSGTGWIDTDKKLGAVWYYKAKARVGSGAAAVYSSYSSVSSAYATLDKVTISSIKAKNGNAAVLTWGKVAKASGYRIYMSKSKYGTYSKVKTVSASHTSATVTGLTNGKAYYFKIRAYCKLSNKTIWGSFGPIKGKIINTYGYADEYYEAKCKRIFGTTYYKDYTSAKQASAHMTKIKVKTWDINSKKKKYTRYFTLTVNKNIASTVKRIFMKIYAGKEKFPIHDLGCYSWRGDSSSSEHCEGLAIDINANENYFYDRVNKKILCGSLYKPGKNAYSIPANGDVVKAMAMYGFEWGIWSTRSDYMHFSYFGT